VTTLKQQISFIGHKWLKETLTGHWMLLNFGMLRPAVANAFG
jgi:hypothetical protein